MIYTVNAVVLPVAKQIVLGLSPLAVHLNSTVYVGPSGC